MRHDIHYLTIRSVVGNTVDEEGRSTPTVRDTNVMGLVGLISDPETLARAAQQSRTIRVGALVPPDVQAFSKDKLIVRGTGELLLDGTYDVVEMRPGRHRKRLICERYEV